MFFTILIMISISRNLQVQFISNILAKVQRREGRFHSLLTTDYSLSVLLGMFMVLIMSCHPSKKSIAPEQSATGLKSWILKYERGPCFGQCPIYAFYLLPDHTGLVNVRANLLAPGWYAAPLDQKTVDEILALLEPDTWWHEDLSGQPEIADLPLLNLTYKHPKGVRMLTVQNRFSESLSHVFEKLNHVVTEGRWVPTDARPVEEPKEVQTDVILQLKDSIDINEWMKQYDRFGIQLKKRITPRQQYYLVSKDPQKGDANDFLQYIKLDSSVISAEWDKEIENRKK